MNILYNNTYNRTSLGFLGTRVPPPPHLCLTLWAFFEKSRLRPCLKHGQSLYGKRFKIILCGIDRVVRRQIKEGRKRRARKLLVNKKLSFWLKKSCTPLNEYGWQQSLSLFNYRYFLIVTSTSGKVNTMSLNRVISNWVSYFALWLV